MNAASKGKIAIIEDDVALAEMYRTKFELEGYEVRTAGDGIQGLALINDFGPDVALVDLLMPKMGGAEMLEQLRAQPGGQSVKVIVLTNVDDNSSTARVYRTAPTDYLVKANVTPEEILTRVQKLMSTGS